MTSRRKRPSTQCVAVKTLRKDYDATMNLKTWCQSKHNLLVCRRGRVFITSDESKEVFTWSSSKWANPYPVGSSYTLKESLDAYETFVREELYDDLDELEGKVLGCFCSQDGPCHARVLVNLFCERFKLKHRETFTRTEKDTKTSSKKICTAVKKDGNPCTYQAKYGDKCGIHNK